tara:strand:- start:96 stop:281 length:186 start_codon:yes stop_codon:yes gene_type:complete
MSSGTGYAELYYSPAVAEELSDVSRIDPKILLFFHNAQQENDAQVFTDVIVCYYRNVSGLQ